MPDYPPYLLTYMAWITAQAPREVTLLSVTVLPCCMSLTGIVLCHSLWHRLAGDQSFAAQPLVALISTIAGSIKQVASSELDFP